MAKGPTTFHLQLMHHLFEANVDPPNERCDEAQDEPKEANAVSLILYYIRLILCNQ